MTKAARERRIKRTEEKRAAVAQGLEEESK